METLKTVSLFGIDISSEYEVFSYSVPNNMIVIAQITLQNIVGNFGYNVHLYSDDVLIVPDHDVLVPNTVNNAIIQSRGILITEGNVITIGVIGDATDINVNVVTKLINASPLMADDVNSIIIPVIDENITQNLKNTEVRPTRTIIGACSQVTRSTLQPKPRSLTTMPKKL